MHNPIRRHVLRSVVSDLVLHLLSMSHKKDARHNWVNSSPCHCNKDVRNIAFEVSKIKYEPNNMLNIPCTVYKGLHVPTFD